MEPISLPKAEKARPRLLFITQKIDENDDDLAFVTQWIKQFVAEGFEIVVICLEKGDFDDSFPVFSLGKEDGAGRARRLFTFLSLIMTLKYDRVFVHMNPEYFTFGGWWWYLRGVPSYFWYTHYTLTLHVRLASLIAKRMFAATAQSLPQFEGNPKKVVLGHGIDASFWGDMAEGEPDFHEILAVHRISRSKQFAIVLQTLVLLPDYRLTVYGRAIDSAYYTELTALASSLGIIDRVRFAGPVPMPELRKIYPRYRLMINMAYETIDKTMLEVMLFGIYPITTPTNARAIGLPVYPKDQGPETLASFIRNKEWEKVGRKELRRIVEERHSLAVLVKNMSTYIRPGT